MAGKFYIVFSPDGPSAPTVMHPTHPSAAGAAWNMARLFPGQTFHIMATAGKPALASVDERPQDQDPKGLEAKPASAVREAQTPKTPLSHAEAKQPALSTGEPLSKGAGPVKAAPSDQ